LNSNEKLEEIFVDTGDILNSILDYLNKF